MNIKEIRDLHSKLIVMDNGQSYRRYPSGVWEILVQDDWGGYWDNCDLEEESYLESVYKNHSINEEDYYDTGIESE